MNVLEGAGAIVAMAVVIPFVVLAGIATVLAVVENIWSTFDGAVVELVPVELPAERPYADDLPKAA